MPNSNDYSLEIKQQPEIARVAGPKEKERKPVDPQPIVQLQIHDKFNDPHGVWESCPHFFMVASLWQPWNDAPAEKSQAQAMGGSTVSSLHRLRDDKNHDGVFFVFHDLAVKREGMFRIKFTLFELRDDCIGGKPGGVNVNSITSDRFKVFSVKEFPGQQESTSLARTFADQGIKLRIRKSTNASKRLKYAENEPRPINRYPPSYSSSGIYNTPSLPPGPQLPPPPGNPMALPFNGWNVLNGNENVRPGTITNGYYQANPGPASMAVSMPRQQYVNSANNVIPTSLPYPGGNTQPSHDFGVAAPFRQQRNDEQLQSSGANYIGHTDPANLLDDQFSRYAPSSYEPGPPMVSSPDNRSLPSINESLNRGYSSQPNAIPQPNAPHYPTGQWSPSGMEPQLFRYPNGQIGQIGPSQPLSPPVSGGGNPGGGHSDGSDPSRGNSSRRNSNRGNSSYGNRSHYPDIIRDPEQ